MFLASMSSMMAMALRSLATLSTCSISQRMASADTKVVAGSGAVRQMKERPVLGLSIASTMSCRVQLARNSLKSF